MIYDIEKLKKLEEQIFNTKEENKNATDIIYNHDKQLETFIENLNQKRLIYNEESSGNPYQHGYIFRGQRNYKRLLQSFLERNRFAEKWTDEKTKEFEKECIEAFIYNFNLDGDTYRDKFKLYYNYNNCSKGPIPPTETLLFLGIMQHYYDKEIRTGQHSELNNITLKPTRLLDFTKDIYVALFFAIYKNFTKETPNNDATDSIIYCFPADAREIKGNKLPKAGDNGNRFKDINTFLWRVLGLDFDRYRYKYIKYSNGKTKTYEYINKQILESKEPNPNQCLSQSYGWDTAYYKNARQDNQKGLFLYSADINKPLLEQIPVNIREEEFAADFPPIKLLIQKEYLGDMRRLILNKFNKKTLEDIKKYLDNE